MAEFDRNMLFSNGLCGHFALGTLSETYLKDAVFKINVQDQNITNKYKNPQMSNLTPKSKNEPYLFVILSQLRHLDIRQLIFVVVCVFVFSLFFQISPNKSEVSFCTGVYYRLM